MPTPLEITDDLLTSELWARDVPFLIGEQINPAPQIDPATLIQSLAQSAEARVRMALIPLFLRHPEFSSDAQKTDKALSFLPAQLYLRFYYTAAVLLQRKYWERLVNVFGDQTQLPDLFSNTVGVTISQDHAQSLDELAKRHQVLSGQVINWLETYEHSAERFIKYTEKFK